MLATQLVVGLVIDPAPLEFFDVRVLSKLDFKYSELQMVADMDSPLNEKTLIISFEHDFDYARLMRLLTSLEFTMQSNQFKFVSPYLLQQPDNQQTTNPQAIDCRPLFKRMQRNYDLIITSVGTQTPDSSRVIIKDQQELTINLPNFQYSVKTVLDRRANVTQKVIESLQAEQIYWELIREGIMVGSDRFQCVPADD